MNFAGSGLRRSSPPRFSSIIFLTLPALMPARAADEHPGGEVRQRRHRLAGRGLFGADHLAAIRLPRRRYAGPGRQGRAGQSDDRAVRRRRRRPRQRRLPEPARRCRRRNALRAAAATRSTARCACSPRRRTRRWSCCASPSRSRASTSRPIDRIRSQIVAGIVADARDPGTAAQTRLVEGGLWRPSLFAPGRGHRADAGHDHRGRSEDAASPAVRARQSGRRRGRRDRCRDAEEGARPAVRRAAGEGRADAGRRCRAQARPGNRRSLRPAADDAAVRLSRRRPQQARIFRRLSDEPHSGRRRFHPRGCSPRCARSAALPTASAPAW